MVSESEQQLLEYGLGNVTWWGYSLSSDVVDKIPTEGGKASLCQNKVQSRQSCATSKYDKI